jgi:hypothetical protein
LAATLLQAIHAAWDTQAGLGAASPPILLFDDDPESGRDFGTYALVEAVEEPGRLLTSSGKRLFEARFSLVWWGAGQDQPAARVRAEALLPIIRGVFGGVLVNPGVLAIDSRRVLLVVETSYAVSLDKTRSAPARQVVESQLDYRVEMVG